MDRVPEGLRLSAGTLVGPWRVEAWQGQGPYGAVYRAVRAGQEHAGPVALKLALYPWDRRVVREAELLSRVSHPGIARLMDRGVLRHASGVEHPWFVMEWVEGTPLYAWAQQHAPSSRQVYRVLAQLARSLDAVHAVGAVHRDVKGDNVLVRLSDNLPVLIDFGSGHYPGAKRLTWQSLAPGTPAYLSAQAGLFEIRLARHRDSYYAPTPADDLYALGVTAYRLVMGEYPPPMKVRQDEENTWHVSSPDPRPLLERNARVEPGLREWIVRLLSDAPEARGTAAALAQALEAMAEEPVPESQPASRPVAQVAQVEAPIATGTGVRPERSGPRVRARAWKPWLAVAAAAGVCVLLLWSVPSVLLPAGPVSTSFPAEVESASTPPSSKQESGAPEPPAEPRLGPPRRQLQPDAKGRCPGSRQVAIDGGCWVETAAMPAEQCVENGHMLRQGKCYAPAIEAPQKPVPTSGPGKAR
ncbi:MAG TPA: protein kinase [Myxococcaceae bacterium]